jgi:hypothetical protein
MSEVPEKPEPRYPLTGTLRYPKDAILDIAKVILRDLHEHRKQIHEKTTEGSEEVEVEAFYDMMEVRFSMSALDLLEYESISKINKPTPEESSMRVREVKSHEERLLLCLGRVKYARGVC